MKRLFVVLVMLCMLQASIAYAAPFINNGNGTVTDNGTGLMWQQAEGGSMTWDNALSYCEGLSLGVDSDWRLPNIKELESLTDDTRYNPAIDTTFFPNAYAFDYWTSTTVAVYPSSAWSVDFIDGYIYDIYKDNGSYGYVRCVRGGLIPAISVNPASVNFRSVNVGESSIKAVTVSNTGTADLLIGTIELTGTDASEFSILNDACSGQTLALSGTCRVDVRFLPTSGIPARFSMVEYFKQAMSLLIPEAYKQSKSAILSIPSNDPDTPTLDVPLSGKGYATMMQRILDIQKVWQRSLFPSAGR